MADLSLVFDLLARDRASSEVEKVGASMDETGDKASRMGGLAKTALIGVGAGVAGAAVGLFAVGSTFDDLSDTIRVGTGATGKALDGLVDSAKTVGSEIPASFEDIGSTITDVNQRLGLTGPTLETLSEQILQAGNIMGEQVDVSGLSAAFSAFNVTGKDTSTTMDDLYRVSQATGVGINDLAAGIAHGAPQLQAFGFSISDSAALLGSLDKAGLNSDATLAALNKGMIAFAKAGKEPRKALEDTIGGIQGFIDKGDQAKAVELAASIFGTKGAGQFVAAVQSGTMNLNDLMGATGATSDTILGAASDTADFAETWELFKNKALLALEPVATRVFNALGSFMAWISDTGAPALQNLAGIIADRVGPALSAVADFVVGTVVPAVKSLGQWIADNRGVFEVVAGIIAAVFIPHLVAMGVAAVVNGVKVVGSWIAQQAATIAAAAVHSAQIVWMIVRWVALGAAAVAQGVIIATVWTAQIVAGAVSGAASFAVQVLRVVGGWVLMGAQSLLQAARMAAAWLIAMGPVGWIIAAVVGLVALIVANWDTVKNWTVGAWQAVVGAVQGAWNWITNAVSVALQWLVNLFLNFTGPGLIIKHWNDIVQWTKNAWNAVTSAVSNAISNVIGFITGLPGKILGVLSGLGTLLVNLGGDLLRGLWNGISGAVHWLMEKVGKFFGDLLPGWVKDILGISSPSKVFAEFGRQSMLGFAGGIDEQAGAAVDAVTSAMAGVTAAGSDMSLGAGGGGLGYSPPGYDLTGAAGGAAGGGATHMTIVSGVVGPEEVAAIVRRDQATTEFLAGV